MSRIYPVIQPLTPARSAILAADPERRQLIDRMLAAETLREVEAAREAQHAWLTANPDDFGVLEAGEYLAYVEDYLRGDHAPGVPIVSSTSQEGG